MKKLLVVLLASLLLAGCGQKEEEPQLIYAAPPEEAPAAESTAPADTGADAANPHAGVELPGDDGGVLEIKEKLFIAQTNDIYLNGQDYLGRTIKYEGLYKNSEDWEDAAEEVIHFVIRYGPGCCGYDGEAGFEVRWPGGAEAEWPAPDDWVEVIGTLKEEVYDSGYRLLYVELASLTVKEERGAETVAT